jgi:cell division protein FtsI/penicillin-binding protein 2
VAPPPRRPTRRRRTPAPPDGVRRRERTGRIRLITGIAVALLALLGLRAAFLETVKADDLSHRALQQNRHESDLLAPRGSILADDGSDLSTDRLAVDITASPKIITKPQEVAARLGPLIHRDPNALANILARGGVYQMLARAVPPAQADAARKLALPGIYFSDTYQRYAPGGMKAAQLIGLTGDVRQGISGMEQQMDHVLTGVPGHRVEVRDLFGRPIKVLQDKEPVPGKDVTLTIDPAIEGQVEEVLAATREQYGAKSAMAMVMDPRNGAILSMATVPRFDPNDRRALNPDLERERPVTDTFEPGSTFKIVTMAGALDDGVITPSSSFWLPTELTLYDRTIHDAEERDAETLTATQILQHSSNIGTVKIAQKLTQARLQAWITRFGFGSPTGIDYPGEVPGLVPTPEQWSGTSILNIPIGQGIGVTLTQLTRAYAAIANGGLLVQPHLVAKIGDTPVKVPAPRRIMHATTAHQVDAMLRKVISSDGTGELAKVKGYAVAGKTGTAQKPGPDGYSTTKYWSSFVGYAPAQDPQLLVAVVIDEPTKGAYYGGDVAAPAFEKIAEFSLQKLRIAP